MSPPAGVWLVAHVRSDHSRVVRSHCILRDTLIVRGVCTESNVAETGRQRTSCFWGALAPWCACDAEVRTWSHASSRSKQTNNVDAADTVIAAPQLIEHRPWTCSMVGFLRFLTILRRMRVPCGAFSRVDHTSTHAVISRKLYVQGIDAAEQPAGYEEVTMSLAAMDAAICPSGPDQCFDQFVSACTLPEARAVLRYSSAHCWCPIQVQCKAKPTHIHPTRGHLTLFACIDVC